MSRIGYKPIEIPSGVNVSVKDNIITVKGSKGELKQDFLPKVSFDIQDKQILVSRVNESKEAKSLHGLYRKLVDNMVIGVTKGFQRTLVINGVGYRAEMKGKNVLFTLGYSHTVEYVMPEGVTASCDGNTKVVVSSIDKAKVGQVASEIRNLRPPEPYKGKGIRYEEEQIRRKVGKSGVK